MYRLTGLNKDQNIMVSTKKYFLYIIFLVSPISLTLYAQNTAEKPTEAAGSACGLTLACNNQNNNTNAVENGNFNQFIVGMSTPKDSLTIAAESNNVSDDCEENSAVTATSILAKEVIENYKYDFSETFIDILFYERIDLARTRTI